MTTSPGQRIYENGIQHIKITSTLKYIWEKSKQRMLHNDLFVVKVISAIQKLIHAGLKNGKLFA